MNTGVDRLEEPIKQLASVKLPVQTLALSFTWSSASWAAGTACLYAVIRAVGVDDTSATKVLPVSVIGKLAGFIQVTLGNIGTIEAALTAALITGGTAGTEAFAAALVYRIVSLVLVAITGWIICTLGFDHKDQPGYQPVTDR